MVKPDFRELDAEDAGRALVDLAEEFRVMACALKAKLNAADPGEKAGNPKRTPGRFLARFALR